MIGKNDKQLIEIRIIFNKLIIRDDKNFVQSRST